MVTSVHGFPHLRESQVKAADSGTLAFSHLLAHASGASWLAVGRPDLPDSNHARDTAFKKRLGRLLELDSIGLVVDIHGAHACRPFDVDIGSMDQASWNGRLDLRDMLLGNLRQHGFYVTDNAVFKAHGSGPNAETVTKFCASKGVPAVELEVSNAFLTDLGGRMALHQNAKLANALVQFLEHAGRSGCLP